MNDTIFNREQYQENEFVTNELNKIFSSNLSERKQYIALNHLLSKVNTPLVKNHVLYFIKKYDEKRKEKRINCIRIAFIVFFVFLYPLISILSL